MLSIKRQALVSVSAVLLVVTTCALGASGTKPEEKHVFSAPDTSYMETRSSRYTQPEPASQTLDNLGVAGFSMKENNQNLEVWFREESGSLRIRDKSTGYVWGELPFDSDPNMNDSWSQMANSIATLEYYDKNKNVQTVSLTDSTANTDYTWDENSMKCSFNDGNLGLSYAFKMQLNADSLTFSVDPGSIEETGDNKVKALYFMPFLGCTTEDKVSGYIFVPDGPGALIRYSKASTYVKGYESPIYGTDVGVDTIPLDDGTNINSQQTTMPVYGVVHGVNRNAIFAIVDDGMEYTSIVSSVSGILTNYNWVAARFDYRKLYTEPTGKNGTGISTIQSKRNNLNPRISFYFLHGDQANYTGMAVFYRGQLQKEGRLSKRAVASSQIPLRLQIVGCDSKKGFLFDTTQKLTTVPQAANMIKELRGAGIRNLTMVYEGWQKGGLSAARLGETSFAPQVGSRNDFARLKDQVESGGGHFYLDVNPVTALGKQIWLLADVSTTMSKTWASFSRQDYGDGSKTVTYVVKPQKMLQALKTTRTTLAGFHFEYSNLGNWLFSDYSQGQTISRSSMEKMVQNVLMGQSGSTALDQPNDYLWTLTSDYFDTPDICSQYQFETDTVPFLQTVLHGWVNYYSDFVNESSFSQDDILKLIDFGEYPSFRVIGSENIKLKNTSLQNEFSLSFADWKGSIQSTYQKVNQALASVQKQQIIARDVLTQGVVRVCYDNGARIYVNYGSQPYVTNGVKVPAKGFLIERGSK